MYTRSYPAAEGIPPEDYRGTAISGGIHNGTDADCTQEANAPVKSVFSGLFERLPFFNKEGGRFPRLCGGSFNFGMEELLIIAAAAVLFFSEGGDKECAVILILLLFIN